jgi:uncharacterized protein (TIGR02679 family)
VEHSNQCGCLVRRGPAAVTPPPTWHVARRDVFVCENPNMACTDGMPSAAQQTLLAQLAAAGARLRYHGDFDWAGLVIGNFLMREFGAEP